MLISKSQPRACGLRWVFVAAALMVLVVAGGSADAVTVPAGPKPGAFDRERADFPICAAGRRVTCVVDGDTIWYRGVKIRIADIDSPEIARPQCEREARLGQIATQRLQSLLNEAPFRLEIPADGRSQDRFGRELRVVKRGDASLGLVLVREGLAVRWGGGRPDWCQNT